MLKTISKNQHGMAAIIMTIMILVSILTITIIANTIILNNLAMNMTQVDTTKAFFAGEAGAEKILYETRKENLSFSGTGINCAIDDYICSDSLDFASSSVSCATSPIACGASSDIGILELSNLSRFSLQYKATTTPNAKVMIMSMGVYGDAIKGETIRNTRVEY